MSRGGRRPGSGRKRGGKSRLNRAATERTVTIITANQEMPLEFLLRLMRAPEPTQRPKEDALAFTTRWTRWAAERFEAAKAAAPFCHPKLAAIELKPGPAGEGGSRIPWDTLPDAQRARLHQEIRSLLVKYGLGGEPAHADRSRVLDAGGPPGGTPAGGTESR